MIEMHRSVILQGSNMGDRYRNLEVSAELIRKRIGNIVLQSSVYETEPWGKKDQNEFINRVLVVETVLKPLQLLESLLAIEGCMGRKRGERWEPRIIDLDILFYDNLVTEGEKLLLPHPQIQYRRFTLAPLAEILPDFIHPVLKQSISSLLQITSDVSEVRKVQVVA